MWPSSVHSVNVTLHSTSGLIQWTERNSPAPVPLSALRSNTGLSVARG